MAALALMRQAFKCLGEGSMSALWITTKQLSIVKDDFNLLAACRQIQKPPFISAMNPAGYLPAIWALCLSSA
jgi:hypothetical protein